VGCWVIQPLSLSLLLTIGFESIFALLYGIHNKKDLLLLALVNMITNPPVVFIYYFIACYTEFHKLLLIILLELFAIIVEAYYIGNYGKTFRRPLFFAIGVNLFSYTCGLLLNILHNLHQS